MAEDGWNLGLYRDFLKVQVRLLALDPRLARRLDSSDLVQETLLRAHERREQFRGASERELVGWLRRVFENVVRDRLDEETAQKRDYRRDNSLEDLLARSSGRLDAILAGGAKEPADELARRELVARLFQAIGALEADQQDAVVLRYLLELPITEIAARLSKTERAVAGLLFRGLKSLRAFHEFLTDEREGEPT